MLITVALFPFKLSDQCECVTIMRVLDLLHINYQINIHLDC